MRVFNTRDEAIAGVRGTLLRWKEKFVSGAAYCMKGTSGSMKLQTIFKNGDMDDVAVRALVSNEMKVTLV